MEALARLLLPLALAHPGHGPDVPICDPGPELSCPVPPAVQVETNDRSELHLAEVLLDRGLAAQAAIRLAELAARNPEAAALLARALELLGDPEGAALARQRAAREDG